MLLKPLFFIVTLAGRGVEGQHQPLQAALGGAMSHWQLWGFSHWREEGTERISWGWGSAPDGIEEMA